MRNKQKAAAEVHQFEASRAGADRPYDWDNYADDFRYNENYAEQERLILAALIEYPFGNKPAGPNTIFEAGPGLGRITAIAHEVYPSATYSALDVSAKALHAAELAVRHRDPSFRFNEPIVGPLQLPHPSGSRGFPTSELVLAIEVLMHIPPNEVSTAVSNLVATLAPGGLLATCDWTEPLPLQNGVPPAVRVQNYRHDYDLLFEEYLPPGSTINKHRIGYQTLFFASVPSAR